MSVGEYTHCVEVKAFDIMTHSKNSAPAHWVYVFSLLTKDCPQPETFLVQVIIKQCSNDNVTVPDRPGVEFEFFNDIESAREELDNKAASIMMTIRDNGHSVTELWRSDYPIREMLRRVGVKTVVTMNGVEEVGLDDGQFPSEIPKKPLPQWIPPEGEVVCIDNLGMEDSFDVGVSYLKVAGGDSSSTILVVDKYGHERPCFAERFTESKQ